MKVDATPPSPVGSVSFGISPDVTLGGNRVAGLDVEQVEGKVELFAARGIKMNPCKWVKKRESQVDEQDQLKLKTVILYDNSDEELIWMNYVWLDLLGRGYVAAVMVQPIC